MVKVQDISDLGVTTHPGPCGEERTLTPRLGPRPITQMVCRVSPRHILVLTGPRFLMTVRLRVDWHDLKYRISAVTTTSYQPLLSSGKFLLLSEQLWTVKSSVKSNPMHCEVLQSLSVSYTAYPVPCPNSWKEH